MKKTMTAIAALTLASVVSAQTVNLYQGVEESDVLVGEGLTSFVDGTAKFQVGGYRSDLGRVVERRIVGLADGIVDNDATTLRQTYALTNQARIDAIRTSNAYTDAAFSDLDGRITANGLRIDRHDVVLEDHENRISALEGRFGDMDGRLDSLEDSVRSLRSDLGKGLAGVAAMTQAMPSLSPGEQAMVMGAGGYSGYGGVMVGYARNHAGAVLSARVATAGRGPVMAAGVAFKF